MLLALKQIKILPGHKVILKDINWQTFEQILEELGEHRSARIAYEHEALEIMVPLPEHEIDKVFITNFVEILLEELDIDFYPLGSTTFKNELMQQGIEPDNCFSLGARSLRADAHANAKGDCESPGSHRYIENEAAIRGKNRLDLTVDPPPDLALEIDVTSRTHPQIYQALGVPELWRFEKGKLQINVLSKGEYIEVEFSPHFPNFPLIEVIPQYLQRVKNEGRNKTMKAFRNWVKAQILE